MNTKLIYDRTRLASKGKPFYIVIYDDVKSGERNCKKLIYADSLREADAKFHDMELNENYNIRRKTPYMKNKLIYKSKTSSKQRSFSKTGDLFIAIGEALDSNNPKSELTKLAKKHDMDLVDLEDAVKVYLSYDLEWENEKIKPVLKKCGFSEETKEFSVKYPSIDFNKLPREMIIEKLGEVLILLMDDQPKYAWEGGNYLANQLASIKNDKVKKECIDGMKYALDRIK